jgi:sodium-dependent dicarboxylate transporter 2/3/5
MSLGIAMRDSGLTTWIVSRVPFEGLPALIVLLGFALAAAIMTSFISNSATASLLLPIVVGVSAVHPVTGGVVVALAASAAMVLPISTPPNAIAYGSGYFSVRDMARAGSIMTGITVVAIALFIYVLF